MYKYGLPFAANLCTFKTKTWILPLFPQCSVNMTWAFLQASGPPIMFRRPLHDELSWSWSSQAWCYYPLGFVDWISLYSFGVQELRSWGANYGRWWEKMTRYENVLKETHGQFFLLSKFFCLERMLSFSSSRKLAICSEVLCITCRCTFCPHLICHFCPH